MTNQLVVDIHIKREAMLFLDKVEDREENDKEFLVKVHHLFPVHRVSVNGLPFQKYWVGRCYCFLPLNFVYSSMNIFGNKREIVLVVLVKITKSDNHIKKSVVLYLLSSAFPLIFFAFKNIVVMCLFIYADCAVYPN